MPDIENKVDTLDTTIRNVELRLDKMDSHLGKPMTYCSTITWLMSGCACLEEQFGNQSQIENEVAPSGAVSDNLTHSVLPPQGRADAIDDIMVHTARLEEGMDVLLTKFLTFEKHLETLVSIASQYPIPDSVLPREFIKSDTNMPSSHGATGEPVSGSIVHICQLNEIEVRRMPMTC